MNDASDPATSPAHDDRVPTAASPADAVPAVPELDNPVEAGTADAPLAHARGGTGAILLYSALRILLFLFALGLLSFVVSGVLQWALALFASGALSFVLLSRFRDAMSAALIGGFGGIRARMDAAERAEDELD